MDYNLHKEPNWFYEVAVCISEHYLDGEEKIIENHSKFGISKEDMERLFSRYKAYKEAVLKDILPVYNNYPSLTWLFKPVDYNSDVDRSMAISIVSYWGQKPTKNIKDDFIDKTITSYIATTISDLVSGVDKENIKIENITDLLDLLESIKIEDDILKMHLIRLYHTRYETIRNLWEMIHTCVPILKKHFFLIREDVNLILKILADESIIKKVLDPSVGVKFKTRLYWQLYPSIFAFNSFKWEMQVEENYSYVGIYFLKLLDLKGKNKFNEDELVSDLKALGDATRLKIIGALLEKEMYLKELAEKLNLTPATVSHHINTMLKSDLIFITIGDEDNRRVYYEVNREKLEAIGNSIKRLAATYKE